MILRIITIIGISLLGIAAALAEDATADVQLKLENLLAAELEGVEGTVGTVGDVMMIPPRQVHTAMTREVGATILVFRVHEQGQPERFPAE